jgi:8-oxo-dGTP diphosphatase
MQQNITQYAYGASAIVQDGDKFLLIKRKNPPAQNMHAFPGGRMDEGEELRQTAIRELQEETGLVGKNPRLYAQYIAGNSEKKFKLHVFKVDVDDKFGAKANDDALDLGWFTITQARKLSLPDNMIDCFSQLEKEQLL